MSSSDAILVGEGWISEHFFTTDATSQSFQAKVLERRKAWDVEAKEERPTPRSRFTAVRQELEVELAGLAELTDPSAAVPYDAETIAKATSEVYDKLLKVLELRGHGLHVEGGVDSGGPLLRVSAPGITERAPLAVVLALPAAAVEDALAKDEPTLLAPLTLGNDDSEFTSAARLVSALFVDEDAAPDLALILAGRWAVLAEQARWAEGRYLAVDLQLICERNDAKRGGEIDRALTCLSAESIAPDADGNLWWHSVLEESVKHTVGVSKDLRDGVRLSIEIIANEVVDRRRARGLEPLPAADANELAKQALRFLYRILFLLYAEASPELGVLPVGAPEYDAGYSLDRLRELVQVELATPRARSGTHLYESLGVLFRLVDTGHHAEALVEPDDEADGMSAFAEGLEFNALRADLFRAQATRFIDAVGLGNICVQQVLAHLLLSKEKRGKDRGFISYAELGINQLGAVYEGLMSYTGFFAETDLYEVAKGGDGSKGSWVVPVERSGGIDAADFIKAPDPVTGELKPVLHPRGSFVFRLAGRERQQSASYYTPEVLTRFTVGQALEELLDQDGERTSAAEILELTVCEPALGSGAFAIEAVRQLAEQYLKRRQDELGVRIDPDEYPRRLQEVKAYLALHNVYGVDLNATAVELAEISLWLDTMVSGLSAPWFGLHLRRGNSLIGARRAVYSRSQVNDKSWLSAVPRDVPLTSLVEDIAAERIASDGIHHFLLPADGWGTAPDAKEATPLINALAPEAVKALKAWRGSVKSKPNRKQVDALVELADRVETLWQIAYRRLSIAEQEARRSIPVWEAGELPAGGAVGREQLEASLDDASGAYRRLRRVMDAWTALWFWPLTDLPVTVDGVWVDPPSLDQWITGLQSLLGRNPDLRKRAGRDQFALSSATSWDELGVAEELELTFAGARPIDVTLAEHPWLVVCERVAAQQGFFHWNLDFATVFVRGGFDLQVGNPPWVRPRSDVDALLAEGDPWWMLAVKPPQALVVSNQRRTLALPGITEFVVEGIADFACTISYLGSVAQYPHLQGTQPDLYRCFIEQTWRNRSPVGTIGLIHPETHFTDEKAGPLRDAVYVHLRRHWQFFNELRLFEVHHHVSFGVHAYGARRKTPAFLTATALYHPDTAINSLRHDGSGPEPGLKDPDGNWDLRPHRDRLLAVDAEVLATWHALLESSAFPVRQTRMVYTVNKATSQALKKFSDAGRIADLSLHFSRGWDESRDRKSGRFVSTWGSPESWSQVILQGPNLYVARPIYKIPNESMRHQTDWSEVDLETLRVNALPVTSYKPAGDPGEYDRLYPGWGTSIDPSPARQNYRIAWRNMTDNTGNRSLIPALIPPGSAHVHGVSSFGSSKVPLREIVIAAGLMSSLVLDFAVRVAPKSTISAATINRLPYSNEPFGNAMALRVLRLNALTEAYAELWSTCFSPEFRQDSWAGGLAYSGRKSLAPVDDSWTTWTPLRIDSDRGQALLEIDVLAAFMLKLTADELCTIYRSQFPVLYGYDRNVHYYDANGRLVPNSVLTVWRKKGDRINGYERTATNQAGNTYTYELPFVTLDREKDMRQAYAHFEQLLAERS